MYMSLFYPNHQVIKVISGLNPSDFVQQSTLFQKQLYIRQWYDSASHLLIEHAWGCPLDGIQGLQSMITVHHCEVSTLIHDQMDMIDP